MVVVIFGAVGFEKCKEFVRPKKKLNN